MALYTENLIPVMTSATAPSGIASSSSNAGSSYLEYFAFNGVKVTSTSFTTGQLWEANAPTGWIAYEFPESKKISKYVIYAINVSNMTSRNPKNWTFEGSNDGTTWTILDTRTNVMFNQGESKSFEFNNNTPYKKYRLNITANNGDAGFVAIAELEMMERIYINKILLSLNGEIKTIIRPVYGTVDAIPTMTSDTAPSGIAFGSTQMFGYAPAFNDMQGTARSFGWYSSAADPDPYLGYEFPTAKVIGKYSIRSMNSSTDLNVMPKSWLFEAYDEDAAKWVKLHEVINESPWSADQRRYYEFWNDKAYKKYRVRITENFGGTAYKATIEELEMFEIVTRKKLSTISTASETNFIDYGIDNLDINKYPTFKDISFIQDQTNVLGSGKIFTHTLDLSKYKGKKISF